MLITEWGAYARYQQELSRRQQVDDRAWGSEAKLNRLLCESGPPATAESAERVERSVSRRERRRDALRRCHAMVLATWGLPVERPGESIDAGRQLRAIREQLSDEEWRLLNAVGEGLEYEKIAVYAKVPAGTLRVQVRRLRVALRQSWPKGG